ncbi:dipeptidase [Parafilimonas sp.]|uniref:dipeptidase n=1 Tax=Parafilimonas sp. TaxID=1969739 RepID=UPI0039E22081
MQTRKQFLRNSVTIAAAMAAGGKSFSKSFSKPVKEFAADMYFDLHAHPGRLFAINRTGFGAPVDAPAMQQDFSAGHLNAVFFALVADAGILEATPAGISIPRQYTPGEAWAEYKKQLAQAKEYLKLANAVLATTTAAIGPSKTAAFIAVEGGDFLEGSAEKLDEAYADGVRSVQLVHYAQNDLGDLQTASPRYNGLSPFGKDVVKRMNKIGMLIDVAHASFATTKDVISITDAPVMLSHSILALEPERPMAKRAITVEHAKLVADNGGIIGAWPSGFNKSLDDYIINILRLVDAVGIDHVGIGTDMYGNFKPVVATFADLPGVAAALQAKGLSATETGKIMGGNAVALVKKF